MSPSIHIDLTSITDLLLCWLSRQVTQDGLTWLDEKRRQIARGVPERVFFTTFSAVPRYTGKQDLKLTVEDLQAAEACRTGWCPKDWSVDRAGRTLLLVAFSELDVDRYVRSLDKLFTAADVGELIALYQSLPLLPYPERHRLRAAEGIRSNITTVFNAVALNNPYPADYFDNLAWNQMVLKAIFVGSPLYLIWGLDRRANPELAQMLTDYARERWAAKRPVNPELWRLVGSFVDSSIVTALETVLNHPDCAQQEAGALACSQSSLPQAQALLARHPHLHALIQEGRLTWSSFSQHRLAASL
jgi:hypothetical protein